MEIFLLQVLKMLIENSGEIVQRLEQWNHKLQENSAPLGGRSNLSTAKTGTSYASQSLRF